MRAGHIAPIQPKVACCLVFPFPLLTLIFKFFYTCLARLLLLKTEGTINHHTRLFVEGKDQKKRKKKKQLSFSSSRGQISNLLLSPTKFHTPCMKDGGFCEQRWKTHRSNLQRTHRISPVSPSGWRREPFNIYGRGFIDPHSMEERGPPEEGKFGSEGFGFLLLLDFVCRHGIQQAWWLEEFQQIRRVQVMFRLN